MALNAINLDELTSGGCMIAGCKHEKHGEVYLHGRCHIRSTANIIYRDGIVHVDCRTCMTPICEIRVNGVSRSPVNNCHPTAGMYAHYKLGSNQLLIECGECHKPLQTMKVSRI